ncbi:MAG: radical SAM protein [bacterium]|nr:radical SAM protein [bacterium]
MLRRLLAAPRGTDPILRGIRHGSRAFCGPEELYIDLTNRCTLRCISCWHRSPLLRPDEVLPHWDGAHELPFERVRALIDEAASMGVRKIIYSGGGDPLLHRDIVRILEHTSARGLEVLLMTNLTAATGEMVRRIAGGMLSQLCVNLWAGSPAVYAATHPGATEETFAKVVDLMRLFAGARHAPAEPELIIAYVISALNYEDIGNAVRLAAEIGVNNIWWQTTDVESANLRGLLLTGEQIQAVVRTMEETRKEHAPVLGEHQGNIVIFDDVLSKLRNSRAAEGIYHSDVIDTIPCYIGWAACRVLANGNVVPCCKADRNPLGNIFEERFSRIWFSRRYDGFRERALRLPKSDRYFARIACARICDNWCLNTSIHRRYAGYLNDPAARRGPGRRAG